MTIRREGCILTPQGWRRGVLQFSARIEAVVGDRVDQPLPGETRILPGFIDLHVHGGAGRDVMEADGAVDAMAKLYAEHGTTSFLATTMTATRPELERALADVGRAMRARPVGSARVLGVHLEGPFINPGRLGAQPAAVRIGTLDEIIALDALARIRVLTLAPELAGHLELIAALRSRGILPQVGHSAGTYEEGVAALEAGAGGFTHLFNAMSELHHRKPGMAGAALAHAEYAEVIPDLLHVHPGALRVACRAIPRLYCVTDSTAATGMPDGNYRLGTQQVSKCLGGVRLADGTLAGSVLTMDQAVRNLVRIGQPLDEAVRRASTYPADYLGESDRGRLREGAWADVVEMDGDLSVTAVYVEGEPVPLGA